MLQLKQGNVVEAEKMAQKAVENVRYNIRALINLGNCFYKKGDLQKAKQYYENALMVDSLFGESLFNLGTVMAAYRYLDWIVGLLYKNAENYVEALKAFEKLFMITQHDPEVLFHMADT